MKQNKNHHLMNRYTTGALAIVVTLAVTLGLIIWAHNTGNAAPTPKRAAGATVKSEFSFAGASGWWQGATNETSMAVFEDSHACFVSAQYNAGTAATGETKQQKAQTVLASSGYVITPGPSLPATLQTAEGPMQYNLQQSSVTTPAGAQAVEGGQEFGYLPLPDGYIFIEGYCDNANELPATIPALQAIRLGLDN